jgi:hypothetical protein
MSPRSQPTWIEAWQAPPAFLEAAELATIDGSCVLVMEPPVTETPAWYGSLVLFLSSLVVGLLALRALKGVHRQVADIEVEHEVVEPTVVLDVLRTRSGIEAKGDVEAHTKRLGGEKARAG